MISITKTLLRQQNIIHIIIKRHGNVRKAGGRILFSNNSSNLRLGINKTSFKMSTIYVTEVNLRQVKRNVLVIYINAYNWSCCISKNYKKKNLRSCFSTVLVQILASNRVTSITRFHFCRTYYYPELLGLTQVNYIVNVTIVITNRKKSNK